MPQSPTWVKVFQQGIAPQLSTAGLVALRDALKADDPRLIQGSTLLPFILLRGEEDVIQGACAMAYPFWQGDGRKGWDEVQSCCAEVACKATMLVGPEWKEFVGWYDTTPRNEAFPALLVEVEAALQRRAWEERLTCPPSC